MRSKFATTGGEQRQSVELIPNGAGQCQEALILAWNDDLGWSFIILQEWLRMCAEPFFGSLFSRR